METGYRFLDHTADVGIEVVSPTIEGVFEIAGCALFDLISPNGANGNLAITLTVEGEDWVTLLVNLLNELLFQFEVNRFLIRRLETLDLSDNQLKIQAWCERFNPKITEISTTVKAATWHMAEVTPHYGYWRSVIYLDL